MDRNKIITRVKKDKTLKDRMLLQDGGIVIDEVADENNQLHYVVKRGTDITVEKANKLRPVRYLMEKKSETIRITKNG